jgi:hypothetical protein
LLPKLELNARFETQLQIACFRFCVSERGVRKRGEKKFRFQTEKFRRETKFERKRKWEIFFRWESLPKAPLVSNMAEVDLRDRIDVSF